MTGPGTRLVLASGSRVRADMLRAAGLDITVDPADVDEPKIEADCRAAGMRTPDVALALAAAKATLVAGRHPGALVIGADQMLDVDGACLRKPENLKGAAGTLAHLAGRDHTLVSAVVLARDAEVIWRHHASACLTMRPLDRTAIADYLDRAGVAVLTSVGAYQLEGLGAQLFERIEGDYFTILGLPLLALLGELRRRGEAAAGLLG
ncbi:MAG TPA: hypothetical protein DC046_13450 [Rhodospirillaceae bacterium]|nr:hypothetical protein [Rhodospirillaceae bacterium]